jgi:MFS family permease
MLALAAGLAWGTVVGPGWSAIGFGLLIGASGGAIRTLEAGAFPRYFGTTHLGAIRGVVAAVSVGSTAFGPVAFALVHDATEGYATALLASAVLPLLVAAAAALLPVPRPLDAAPGGGPENAGHQPEQAATPPPVDPPALPAGDGAAEGLAPTAVADHRPARSSCSP